jgi:hypothetical protein
LKQRYLAGVPLDLDEVRELARRNARPDHRAPAIRLVALPRRPGPPAGAPDLRADPPSNPFRYGLSTVQQQRLTAAVPALPDPHRDVGAAAAAALRAGSGNG